MDNECNNSELKDLNKTVTKVEETPMDPKAISRSESPVFKCFNQCKTKRGSRRDSSDYDIPSYQINQSVKRRTSGKHESETGDSILPFSPGFSPIPTFSQQFQPHSIQNLGTVAKLGNLNKTDNANINSKSVCDGKKDGRTKSSVFESLGMIDKDISWISSMATPPPQVPGSSFNTIEKATFFPEENFQNIQPRALFSPTRDDDFGCKPLSFSSESEDDSYKTDIRLSDVCTTLKQLDVRSLEQTPIVNEMSMNEKNDSNCETSPVIKMRKQKKLGSKNTKKKQGELKSSELDKKSESSIEINVDVDDMSDKLKSNKVNKTNSQSTNFIDDDSFQSISFTSIDELCKTLANSTERANSSAGSKTFENDCEKSVKDKSDVPSISKADTSFRKQFYRSKVDSNICSVPSHHNLHSYARAFVNVNGAIQKSKVIDRSVAEKGVVRFDAFAKVSSTSHTISHSELSIEKCKATDKKLKTENDESSNWDTMSKYLSESQLNVSDSEIFKTVEKLEKSLGSQENKVLGNMKEAEKSKGDKCESKNDGFQLKGDVKGYSNPISKTDLKDTINSLKEAQSLVASTLVSLESTFETAFASEVTVPDIVEGKQSSKGFQNLEASTTMRGFCTGSGKQIQISEKALEKAKLLMVECEEKSLKETSEDLASKRIEEFQSALESSLSCDKIGVIENNKECLGLSDVTVTGSGISISEILSQDKELLAEFSKSHESFQNLSISAAASGEPENVFTKKEDSMTEYGDRKFEDIKENVMVGFSTASGSQVKITKKALEKAKELMTNCDETSEDVSQSLTRNWMQDFVSKDPVATEHEETHIVTRFSTASGNNVNITEEALQKAKKLMTDCDQTFEDLGCQSLTKNWMQNFVSKDPVKTKDETHIGIRFSTASGNKVKITEEALEKAKRLVSDYDQTCEDMSQSLTKYGMQSFVNKDPVKTKDETVVGLQFSTASGNNVNITEEALQKAQELMANCDQNSENVSQSLIKNWMQNFVSKDPVKNEDEETQIATGFSTVSGNKIKITGEALDKAKVLMSKCNESSTDAFDNLTENRMKDFESKDRNKVRSWGAFSTASGNKIKVTEEALEKAKELMASCDKASEDASQSLTKNWMQNFVSKDPVSTKHEETGIATGFSTGSGDKVKVSDYALEKAKVFMSKCVVENLEMCSKVGGNRMEDVTDDSEIDKLMMKFSTASGNSIKVSGKALNKAKTFMSKCDEISNKMCEPLTKSWMKDFVFNDTIKTEFDNETSAEIPPMCFSTAAGSEVMVSEDALKKARENLAEVWSQDLPEKSRNPLLEKHDDKSGFSESTEEEGKESKRCCGPKDERDPRIKRTDPEKPKVLNDLTGDASLFIEGNLSESDWEEIIPSWLHVYNTSPSMASDRVEMSPVVSHEDGKYSNPAREYIVKSPVLGLGDRFYKKGKKSKREVEEEETKVEERTSSRSFNVPYKDGGKKNMAVKRTSLNLSIDFSIPFKKGKFIEGEIDSVAEIQKSDLDVRDKRMKARLQQDKTCKEKKQVKPLRGSHLQKKVSEPQKKWMEAVDKAFPDIYSDEFLKSLGVKENVLRISVDSASDFKFSAEDFYGSTCVKNVDGIFVGDGCFLIPDEENKFGVKEVKRAFLASPGVQPNLVPDGWVENHYKWLVWKFSHYERSFPRFFGGRCLNPNNLMLQLKYRYDREIDRNERSALKKILERDDSSVKRMVLCVCGIKKVIIGETVEYELTLTDGWYSVSARSDSAFTPFIERDKVQIGTKLITQGAVLVNCEQGTSPLQASSDVHLRIFTNSTRRVRWDTKLGFQKNPHNFTISLSSILSQGGQISKIDVIVVRIYPVLYMEKTSEGHSVTRNARSEEKAELEYCRLQERKMEKIYDEMSKYGIKDTQGKKKVYNGRSSVFERDRNLCDSANKDSNFLDSQEFVEDENDCLTQSEHLDEDMMEKFQEKLNNENLIRRNVSQFLRMKIVDYRKPDYNNPATLTVWNPNEEVVSLFSEGKVMSLMNVAVSKSSRTYKSLQINTTRQTLYKEIVSKAKYPARQLTPLREVASKICPVFEEVDLVGIVILIKDVAYGSRSSQIIYLADLDFHFVGIVFWGSPKDYGWENALKLRSIVACSNLQWKKSCGLQEVPSLQVNESTVFTENPKQPHLKGEVEKLKENIPEDKNDFLTKCEEKLTEKLEESKWQGHSNRNSSGNDSMPKNYFSAKSRHIKGFESKPTASSTPIKPFPVSLNSSEAEPSPIQKRIQKLQSYGEPPPLIPLIVTNNVRKYKKKC